MTKKTSIQAAFKAAFPHTLPILAGFLFFGSAYGIYARSAGIGVLFPILTSIAVFAGSLEFLAIGLLTGTFDPLGAFILSIVVNARHIFYGLSMLDKYKSLGGKKFYLIFGLCDETFSLANTLTPPESVDSSWFYFFITLLNHLYWVAGVTFGSIAGSLLKFETKGLSFVMTALFLVIFIEQWLKDDSHISAITGLIASALCLGIFGPENFVIPSMIIIIIALTGLKKPIEKSGDVA